MGCKRNGATFDSPEFDRAADDCGDCERGRRPHSRICANARANRHKRETEKKEQRLGAKIRPVSGRRTQALHRQTISDEAGSGIYGTRWFVAWCATHTFVRPVVSKRFHATDRDVALRWGGR